jgi:hypothetical protein
MNKKDWWWAVSADNNTDEQIDSSNNYESSCKGGETARGLAERCARNYTKE